MIAIEAKNLSFAYDETNVLKDINMSISYGECVAITGKSGSGKSTLCNIFSGIINRSKKGSVQGEVLIDSKKIDEYSLLELIQLIGIVFQNPDEQLFSPIVEDEIAFGPENLALSHEEIEKRISDSLKAVNMHDYRYRSTSELSGGQRQLIALAAVLSMKPKIFIFDEAMSQLDQHTTESIKQCMLKLKSEGCAVLYVTHDECDLDIADKIYNIENKNAIPRKYKKAEYINNCKIYAKPLENKNSEKIIVENSENNAIIQLENITYTYPKNNFTLKCDNLVIEKSKATILTGNIGTGKSTLFKLCCGILKPDTGLVRISGQNISNWSLSMVGKHVAYLFQEPAHQLFTSSVWEEMTFIAALRDEDKTKTNKKALDLLKKFDLLHLVKRNIYGLSRGEKQRLAIATMMMQDVKAFLFDEPTTGLDIENRERLFATIEQLCKNDIGVAIITHDLNIINRFGSGFRMENGVLVK